MLEKIKLLLGIGDGSLDATLELLLDMATSRLLLIIGADALPLTLEHIVVDATLARFNRIGSEGLIAHTVEGETQTFAEDDFAAYADDIKAYMASREGGSEGKVRFL